MAQLPAYIIHVQGNKERKSYMDKNIAVLTDINWSYIYKGNIEELDETILHTFFKGKMHAKTAFTSCAYKHILAIEKGIKQPWFLVVEDDIEFYPHFQPMLTKILSEIANKGLSNSIISLEDSIPKYIPKSDRILNQFLYHKDEMRLAGAYLMDAKAAQNVYDYLAKHKSDLTADWFYTHLIKKGTINCYWSQPAIACQKSIDGGLPSLIDNKPTGLFRQINFGVQKWIKKLRANFK